ncbi:MAG: aspartyl protease family protein [Chloroflexi bacterium]|nr:aspartyl protease family protein [Chloroflexota bacterium]
MGLFEVAVRVANPADRVFHKRTMLVDTGATHSALPASFLRELGVTPDDEREFSLADSEMKTYPVGEVRFSVGDRERTAPVILGDEGMYLFGATSLQNLDLVPDTTNHQLIAAPTLLVGIRGTPVFE